MAERLAALGLRPPVKAGESPEQRQEREKREREDKLRQAEEEDARREEERQRRLNDESIAPPTAGKTNGKKPPPPPVSRKNKSEVAQHDTKQAEAEAKRAENEIAERALREQQEAQEAETKRMEYVIRLRFDYITNFLTGMRNVNKRPSLLENAKQPRPDFVRWKNKSSKAKSKRMKRNDASKLHNAKLRRKSPGLQRSVLKLRQHAKGNGSCSYS